MTVDAEVKTVTSFHVYPGRVDYVLTDGQGSISFRREQRIVVVVEEDGTFTITFEARSHAAVHHEGSKDG